MVKSSIVTTLILTCWMGMFSLVEGAEKLKLKSDTHVVLVGNGLASRMLQHGFFETELFRRHAKHRLVIRNMADEGNTPGFRPHSGRPSPWAFPGAEAYYAPLSDAKDRWGSGHKGHGTYDSPDAWLTRLSADVIIAFFGYNASFNGAEGLEAFKNELRDFIRHTMAPVSYTHLTLPTIYSV